MRKVRFECGFHNFSFNIRYSIFFIFPGGCCFKVPFYNIFWQALKYQNLKVVAVWKLSSSTDLPAGITLYL